MNRMAINSETEAILYILFILSVPRRLDGVLEMGTDGLLNQGDRDTGDQAFERESVHRITAAFRPRAEIEVGVHWRTSSARVDHHGP